MPRPVDNQNQDHLPSEIRRTVYGNNQFKLPPVLVREIGFQSPLRCDGAKTAWYYHAEADKAILSDNNVNRASLELCGSSVLGGISNADLESEEVSTARVTIINELPKHLVDRLTHDRVVLKPIYAQNHDSLNSTCISVYPERDYDLAKLSNIDNKSIPATIKNTSSGQSTSVGSTFSHTNSV